MWEIRVAGARVLSLLLFLDFEILIAMQVKGLLQFSIRHIVFGMWQFICIRLLLCHSRCNLDWT